MLGTLLVPPPLPKPMLAELMKVNGILNLAFMNDKQIEKNRLDYIHSQGNHDNIFACRVKIKV